jgi:hypothetical protein
VSTIETFRCPVSQAILVWRRKPDLQVFALWVTLFCGGDGASAVDWTDHLWMILMLSGRRPSLGFVGHQPPDRPRAFVLAPRSIRRELTPRLTREWSGGIGLNVMSRTALG